MREAVDTRLFLLSFLPCKSLGTRLGKCINSVTFNKAPISYTTKLTLAFAKSITVLYTVLQCNTYGCGARKYLAHL